MDRYGKIEGMEDIVDLIDELGFLPFFRNPIEGFSLEEKTPQEFWFDHESVGVWEWKGPIISRSESAYGKFYRGKAVWISRDWYPDFVNYRRFRRHLTADEKFILETLKGEDSLLSKELKAFTGYSRPRTKAIDPFGERLTHLDSMLGDDDGRKREGFETALTHLQMAGYVIISDFEYSRDKKGNTYGWGVARYTTPESYFGESTLHVDRTPLSPATGSSRTSGRFFPGRQRSSSRPLSRSAGVSRFRPLSPHEKADSVGFQNPLCSCRLKEGRGQNSLRLPVLQPFAGAEAEQEDHPSENELAAHRDPDTLEAKGAGEEPGGGKPDKPHGAKVHEAGDQGVPRAHKDAVRDNRRREHRFRERLDPEDRRAEIDDLGDVRHQADHDRGEDEHQNAPEIIEPHREVFAPRADALAGEGSRGI